MADAIYIRSEATTLLNFGRVRPPFRSRFPLTPNLALEQGRLEARPSR